ncbi:hypothetical protein HMI54_007404 [Coelomomyces lativittatus]|nr:hypothetical protein HMI54_007404 [Coelomomyces lativittatus]KAJ1510038.1 hypothetical protein HMI56_006528 [Coelomomyces lativittatus]
MSSPLPWPSTLLKNLAFGSYHRYMLFLITSYENELLRNEELPVGFKVAKVAGRNPIPYFIIPRRSVDVEALLAFLDLPEDKTQRILRIPPSSGPSIPTTSALKSSDVKASKKSPSSSSSFSTKESKKKLKQKNPSNSVNQLNCKQGSTLFSKCEKQKKTKKNKKKSEKPKNEKTKKHKNKSKKLNRKEKYGE